MRSTTTIPRLPSSDTAITRSGWEPLRFSRIFVSRTLQAFTASIVIGASLAISACATGRELDARFDAGWRPPRSYCTWGGETPKLDAYCAKLNFGDEGTEALLRDTNEKIVRANGKLSCTDHVALVKRALAPYDDLRSTDIYSCDGRDRADDGAPICHVSLLVTDNDTRHAWVVDNGHVISLPTASGVASFAAFETEVSRYWIGTPPSGLEVNADHAGR